MKHLYGKTFLQTFFSLLIFISNFGYMRAKENDNNNTQPLHKTQTSNYYAPMLINNIFNYYGNNGDGSYNIFSAANEGFEFPKGSNYGTTVFEDGLVWTAFQNDTLKCGGSTYNHGLQPGRILTSGTATSLPVADDPTKAEYRIYRVRPDMKPTANSDSAAFENSLLASSEVTLISRFERSTTVDQLRQQYWEDWNEWPASEGAPFTDVNHDGVYEPTIDIPGFPGADQTEWMVMNDLNQALSVNLYGSTPIGLEVQRTIWAYNTSGAMANTIFIQYKLFNKSGVRLDSMYLAQWADPDLGVAGDDYVGCDTLLNLGFCYNGQARDANYFNLGLAPPAVGFDLLQGPIVPSVSIDSAIFGGRRVHGYKNLPMTAFSWVLKCCFDNDPQLRDLQGTSQWYNFMRGLHSNTGEQLLNPITGLPTTYIFSGDPVAGTGWNDGLWVDGTFLYPADRRMALCSGPFTMAPGDTQEIVIATIAAQGTDRLQSVSELKSYDKIVQKIFDSFFTTIPPSATVSVSTAGNNATVYVSSNAVHKKIISITASLKKYDGSTVATLQLYDDGAHQDGQAGDGVFGGSATIPQRSEGLYADFFVQYASGDTTTWDHVLKNITTAQPLKLLSSHIVSDNLNQDGIANPGENVRYVFSLMNGSAVQLTNLTITPFGRVFEFNSPQQSITITQLNPSSQVVLSYDPTNPSTYFSFDVPDHFTGSTFQDILKIEDAHGDVWFDTLMFPVKPLIYPYVNGTTRHVSGSAAGAFSVSVVEAPKTTNHTYFISWVDSINTNGDPGYSVMDSTTLQMLLVNQPLPDEYGHTSPEIDGFKILFGSIDTAVGLYNWGFIGTRHWTFSNAAELHLSLFSGAIGTAYNEWYSSSTILPKNMHDIEFDFAITDTAGNILSPNDSNVSFAYRYLRNSSAPAAQPSFAPFIVHSGAGFAYQDYNKSMPLAAYEVIGSQKRRLMIGFLENNVPKGLVDGKYWPPYYNNPVSGNNTDTTGPMEWFFVFDKDYSTTPDPTFEVDISSTKIPMMVFGTPARRDTGAWSGPSPSWSFILLSHHNPTNQDVWAFTPTRDVVLPPVSVSVFQNYPNPFNSSTTIQYEIPMRGKVTVTIYDILGRVVKTLINTEQPGGVYKTTWDMQTNEHIQVSSGVYFYRVMFSGDDLAHTSFVGVKKMLVLK